MERICRTAKVSRSSLQNPLMSPIVSIMTTTVVISTASIVISAKADLGRDRKNLPKPARLGTCRPRSAHHRHVILQQALSLALVGSTLVGSALAQQAARSKGLRRGAVTASAYSENLRSSELEFGSSELDGIAMIAACRWTLPVWGLPAVHSKRCRECRANCDQSGHAATWSLPVGACQATRAMCRGR